MFNKFISIKIKLFVSFILLTVLTITLGYVSVNTLQKVSDNGTDLYRQKAEPLHEIGTIAGYFHRVRSNVLELLVIDNLAEKQSINTKVDQRLDQINKMISDFDEHIISPEDKALYASLLSSHKEYEAMLKKIRNLAMADRNKEGLKLWFNEANALREKEQTVIENLSEMRMTEASALNKANIEMQGSLESLSLWVIAISCLFTLGIGLFNAKMVTSPLTLLKKTAEAAANGDFSVRADIKQNDEFGSLASSFNNMIEIINDEIAAAKSFQLGINGAFCIADKSTNILAINEASCRFMGYNARPEEIIGKKTMKDVFLQDTVTRKAFAGEFMRGNKIILKDHSGQSFPVIVQSGPIYNSKKEMTAAFIFFTDLRDIDAQQKEFLKTQIAPIAESLKAVAGGDLTAEVKLEKENDLYELGQSVNKMIKDLNRTLSAVNEAVQAAASAATEISSSSEEMASGAQEQSMQTSEIAASIEEMTRTIFESAQNVSKAGETSAKTSVTAKSGVEKIENANMGMKEIVRSAEETGHIISSLAKKTDQIGEIAQVIDDIADQTNLLALNAAIEAARAGEQGRGFAVVADEVRKLAERTTKATKEISETIISIQREAKEADASMEKAGHSVESGLKLNAIVDAALKEIVREATNVNDAITQVAAASEEQSSAAEQISKNIDGIRNVTQQTAGGIEQIARAAEDLSRMTVNLQELVAKFHFNKYHKTA
jgi:methyl-accepting chemotaxis protein